jgi:MoxR-like ATPase
MQLPGNARTLVRDAVRNLNPDSALLGGRKVNELPKDDLIAVATRLGIDVAAIVASANGAPQGETDAPAPEHVAADTYANEASAIRKQLATAMVEGDFEALNTRIRELVTAAHKAPETVTITETVYVNAVPNADGSHVPTVPRPAHVPSPLGAETWGKLFDVKGARASAKIHVYSPHPMTPALDTNYKFPSDATVAILAAMVRGRNVWLHGPAGTGKTTWPMQLCARTGRPFALVACDDTTEAPELTGMTVPHQGGVRWQDGVLTAAMRVPHCVILIDEPTVARAGALMVLQSVLANRMLSIKETGEVVRCAEGVRFLVADNTNGTGGGTAEGYEGTRRMNRAMLDRFSAFVRFDYLPTDQEAEALVAHTSCTPQLAYILVECATLTRKARVTHALGLRRLIAWAEALTDGITPRAAFEYCVLNSCARDDREPIEQACALGLDRKSITMALQGTTPTPVPLAPSPVGAVENPSDFAD